MEHFVNHGAYATRTRLQTGHGVVLDGQAIR